MKTKRLFLFAGYNPKNLVDDALAYYVHELSKCGDVIVVMDCDCPKSELKKIDKYCIHASGARHGEYDFGSYKRAYIWATKNLNLSDYDFVYMVNDSVYGPMYPISQYLKRMESLPHDAFGIVCNPHKHHPHIQSWFIGMNKNVFTSKWLKEFILSITKLPSKGAITRQYEHGFSKLLTTHGHGWTCLYTVRGRGVYNKIKKLYRKKMPFMKRVAFTRTHGALGRQIVYILNHISPKLRDAILNSVTDLYGTKYVKRLLTRNPLRIACRKIHHMFHKIYSGGF